VKAPPFAAHRQGPLLGLEVEIFLLHPRQVELNDQGVFGLVDVGARGPLAAVNGAHRIGKETVEVVQLGSRPPFG